MNSSVGCQISSMISTFENCENLKLFTLKGFYADQLKSMHKLFYKSGLQSFILSDFNTINLEDISYMFSGTHINHFSFNVLI